MFLLLLLCAVLAVVAGLFKESGQCIQWTVFPDRSNDQILDERKGKARLKIGHARPDLF